MAIGKLNKKYPIQSYVNIHAYETMETQLIPNVQVPNILTQ